MILGVFIKDKKDVSLIKNKLINHGNNNSINFNIFKIYRLFTKSMLFSIILLHLGG